MSTPADVVAVEPLTEAEKFALAGARSALKLLVDDRRLTAKARETARADLAVLEEISYRLHLRGLPR